MNNAQEKLRPPKGPGGQVLEKLRPPKGPQVPGQETLKDLSAGGTWWGLGGWVIARSSPRPTHVLSHRSSANPGRKCGKTVFSMKSALEGLMLAIMPCEIKNYGGYA